MSDSGSSAAGLSERLERMCVPEDATLWDLLRAIQDGGHEIAFVLNADGVVLGTVTDGDIRRALLSGVSLEARAATRVMSSTFQSVRADGNHRAAALETMRHHMVQQVPVLDERGRLTGIHLIEEYIDRAPLPNPAVVLAGGKGTRLRPITEHVPKPMVPVAGRPILERLVMSLVSAGVRRIHLAVNYKKEVIKEYFGDGQGFGCEISYLEEEVPLGTGGPLSLLPDRPTASILHLNGDLVGDFPFREILQLHEERGYAATMGVGLHRYVVPYGVVEIQDGHVASVTEKPPHHWWVNYGIYALSPEVLDLVPRGVEYPVTDLFQACLKRGMPVGSFEISGDWHDVGRPEDLAAARGGSPLR